VGARWRHLSITRRLGAIGDPELYGYWNERTGRVRQLTVTGERGSPTGRRASSDVLAALLGRFVHIPYEGGEVSSSALRSLGRSP